MSDKINKKHRYQILVRTTLFWNNFHHSKPNDLEVFGSKKTKGHKNIKRIFKNRLILISVKSCVNVQNSILVVRVFPRCISL